MIVGGEDEPFRDAKLRDRLLEKKTARLARRLDKLLPSLDTEPAFAWAGTFANDITFGVIAARILTDLCLGTPNEDARLFRLNR